MLVHILPCRPPVQGMEAHMVIFGFRSNRVICSIALVSLSSLAMSSFSVSLRTLQPALLRLCRPSSLSVEQQYSTKRRSPVKSSSSAGFCATHAEAALAAVPESGAQ